MIKTLRVAGGNGAVASSFHTTSLKAASARGLVECVDEPTGFAWGPTHVRVWKITDKGQRVLAEATR